MARQPLHKPWTETDDQMLRRLWKKSMTCHAIARRMNRAATTVQNRAARLGLAERNDAAAHTRVQRIDAYSRPRRRFDSPEKTA